MQFNPEKDDDHTLIEAIKNLRHPRSSYLAIWGQKRLAALEREANRRKLNIPTIKKNDRATHDGF